MATYDNNLRLKEITPGDEDGTWGGSTNDTLERIGEALGANTVQLVTDGDQTFDMADGVSSPTRAMFLAVTSAAPLTATRTVTLGPSSVSKVWVVHNATTGDQAITVKQGSGASVDIANGTARVIVSDGAGAAAAMTDVTSLLPLFTTALADVEHDAATGTHKFLSMPVQGADPTPPAGGIVFYTKVVGGEPEIFALTDGASAPLRLTENGGTTLNVTITDDVIQPDAVSAAEYVHSPIVKADSFQTDVDDAGVVGGVVAFDWEDSTLFRVTVTSSFSLQISNIPTTVGSAVAVRFVNQGNFRMTGLSLNGGTLNALIPSAVNPNLTQGGSPSTPTVDLFTFILISPTQVLVTPTQDFVPFSPT